MITPKISYIKELVEPEHQLFHHLIHSCSYNLNRQELSKILVDNMNSVQLAEYVSAYMIECFSNMPQNECIENMYSYYDEEFVEELIEEVKEID